MLGVDLSLLRIRDKIPHAPSARIGSWKLCQNRRGRILYPISRWKGNLRWDSPPPVSGRMNWEWDLHSEHPEWWTGSGVATPSIGKVRGEEEFYILSPGAEEEEFYILSTAGKETRSGISTPRIRKDETKSGISTPRIVTIRITLTVGRFDYRTKDKFLIYREWIVVLVLTVGRFDQAGV